MPLFLDHADEPFGSAVAWLYVYWQQTWEVRKCDQCVSPINGCYYCSLRSSSNCDTLTYRHTQNGQDEWILFFSQSALHSIPLVCEFVWATEAVKVGCVWIRGERVCVCERVVADVSVGSVCVWVRERSISFIWQRDQIWRHVPEPERFSASLLPTCPAARTGYSIREQPLGSTRQKGKTVALTPK